MTLTTTPPAGATVVLTPPAAAREDLDPFTAFVVIRTTDDGQLVIVPVNGDGTEHTVPLSDLTAVA